MDVGSYWLEVLEGVLGAVGVREVDLARFAVQAAVVGVEVYEEILLSRVVGGADRY